MQLGVWGIGLSAMSFGLSVMRNQKSEEAIMHNRCLVVSKLVISIVEDHYILKSLSPVEIKPKADS